MDPEGETMIGKDSTKTTIVPMKDHTTGNIIDAGDRESLYNKGMTNKDTSERIVEISFL